MECDVQLEFGDETLRRLAYEPSFTLPTWDAALISDYRRALTLLSCAADETDLQNVRALRYRRHAGKRKGICSVRVTDHHRIEFRLGGDERPAVVTVLGVVDDT